MKPKKRAKLEREFSDKNVLAVVSRKLGTNSEPVPPLPDLGLPVNPAIVSASLTSFRVDSVAIDGDRRELEITVTAPGRSRQRPMQFRTALPLSGRPQYFLWDEPGDAEDWAGQLWIYLEEELLTLCAEWGVYVEDGAVDVMVLEPYGVRSNDPARHRRLLALGDREVWRDWVLPPAADAE